MTVAWGWAEQETDNQAVSKRQSRDEQADEHRGNIAFARFLKGRQAAIRPPLSQAEWARETERWVEGGITAAYLNRIIRYEELLREGSENLIKRPRPRLAIAILRVLEFYHKDATITRQGLRVLGYDPSYYLDDPDSAHVSDELADRIRALPPAKRRLLETMLEGMERE